MCGPTFIGMVLFTVVELKLLLGVSARIGGPETFLIVVITGVAGLVLARQQSFAVLGRLQGRTSAADEAALEAPLLLLGALALLLPGFISDAAGGLLLLPPVRARVAQILAQRARRSLGTRGRRAHRRPAPPSPGSSREVIITLAPEDSRIIKTEIAGDRSDDA